MSVKIRCCYNIAFLKFWGIQAITLYPFIFFAVEKPAVSKSLFRHELEHIYQVQRLGWFRLYYSYLKFYFQQRYNGLSHFEAYWSIPFEVEARSAEAMSLNSNELAQLGLSPDDTKS